METTRKSFGFGVKVLLILFAGLLVMLLVEWIKKERMFATQNACISNLRMLEGAKEQAAIVLGVKPGSRLTREQIAAYVKPILGTPPVTCPGGGKYSINPLRVSATCSIPGHQLPR